MIVLPEKQPSTHFEGYYYQKVRCRHCNEPLGYLYTPINGTYASIRRNFTCFDLGIAETSLSILDFCPYTKCWDVESIIQDVLNEVQTLRFKSGISSISFNSDFTVCFSSFSHHRLWTRRCIHQRDLILRFSPYFQQMHLLFSAMTIPSPLQSPSTPSTSLHRMTPSMLI